MTNNTQPTNEDRRHRAQAILDQYTAIAGAEDDLETAVVDLIADLLHLFDGQQEGTVEAILDRAAYLYNGDLLEDF